MSVPVYRICEKFIYDKCTGSVSFDGVRFQVYSHDHSPRHAHGSYGSTMIVVEFGDENAIGLRRGSKIPPNAKRSDVMKILNSAVDHYQQLVKLWEETHMARLADDIEEQITQALANARDFYDYEVASSVRYIEEEDLLLIMLTSGRRVIIPVEDLQDLAYANRAFVAKVELRKPYGQALHWEELDVHFSVLGLADGLYGNEHWMAALPERRRAWAAAALLKTA